MKKTDLKQVNKVKKQDDIKTGLSDLTHQLFGDKVDPNELGRYIYGEKFDPKINTKIYHETNQQQAYALGEFIAIHQYDLDDKYTKSDAKERTADFKKIISGDDNIVTRYEIENGFNKKMEGINYKKGIDKDFIEINKQTENSRKSYLDKISNINPDLREKITNGGVLTDSERQELSDLQQEFKNIQSQYDKIATDRNIDPEKFFEKGVSNESSSYYNSNRTYNDFQNKTKQIGGNINDISVSSDGHVIFNTPKYDEMLESETKLNSMNSKAMSSAMGKWSEEKTYKDYRRVFKDYSDDEIGASYKKLLNLEDKGIELSDDAKEVLINKAAALRGKVDINDEGLNAIDKNAEVVANRYKISNDNIKYVAATSAGIREEEVFPLAFGRGLTEQHVRNLKLRDEYIKDNKKGVMVLNDGIALEIGSEGKVRFSDYTWANMTDEEKNEYKNLKGTEDLSDLDNSLKNRRAMASAMGDNNFKGTDDEFLEYISNKWENSKDATSSYGMTKAQQFKEMGASDKMISKLEKGEQLTGKDIKGFKYQQFDESYVELGNMDEDVMNNMIDSYKKEGITSLNNLGTNNNKQVKAATIYENIIKNKAGALNDIDDDFSFNLNVSDDKAVRKFLENINTNRTTENQIDVAKMMSEYVTKSKTKSASKLNVGEIVEAYTTNGATGVSNLIKNTNDQNSRDMFNKAFDKVIGGLEKSDNEDLKNLGNHFKKIARDDDFAKDVMEKVSFKETIEKAPEFKILKDGKGIEFAKKAIGNKAVQIGAGIAAAVGVGSIAINAMSKAAEERERKRQEMNMLIASQNASVRGGY